jgi:hypothetical protein
MMWRKKRRYSEDWEYRQQKKRASPFREHSFIDKHNGMEEAQPTGAA